MPDVPVILNYIVETDHYLFVRLGVVIQEMIELNGELAMMEADAVRERARVLQTTDATSSAQRRDRVNMEVVEPVATALELRGALAALHEEKWYIIRILDSRRNDDDAVGMSDGRTSASGRGNASILDELST